MISSLTGSNHPSNIAVFEAATLEEAIFKADKAIQYPGIKGAVWRASEAPVDTNKEVLIHHLIKKTHTGQMTIHILPDKNAKYKFLFPFKEMTEGSLDDVRLQNMMSLAKIFNSPKLVIKHQTSGELRKHYDGTRDRSVPENVSKIFSGAIMRLLVTRQGPGTIVYEESGPAAPGWQVQTGDYLFVVGADSIMGRALYHSAPSFTQPENQPRVLDMYDFKAA